MASKVWTNADLKTSGPTTTYGPWRTVERPRKPGDAPPAADPYSGNADSILADAKRTLARLRTTDNDRLAQLSRGETMEEQRLNRESTLGGQIKANPLRTIKEGVMGAALPLALAPGALGMAAGAPLALEALMDAASEPTLGNAAMAGLGALPYVRAARTAMGAGKAASTVGKVLKGADAFADAAPRSVSPKVPATAYEAPGEAAAFTRPAANPIQQYAPNSPASAMTPVADEAGESIEAMVQRLQREHPLQKIDQFMPNAPADDMLSSMQVVDDVGGVNASGESAASLEALSRMTGMSSRGEQFGVMDRAGRFLPKIGPDAVDYVPRVGETYGVMTPNGFQVLADMGGKVGRPPASAIHAAERAGAPREGVQDIGGFGFEELPEISEGELGRMQELFKRLGI